jgi:methionyl-tRNA formyltransferase
MKLVFCGTPRFAVPTLEALCARRSMRSRWWSHSPTGPWAETANSPLRPSSWPRWPQALRSRSRKRFADNAEFRAQLEAIAPDAIVVVAYGRLIPPWMLALPRLGCINLHASLLPRYRGAAPIQWAVANGDAFTGNTTMLLEEGLDTGPILLQRAFGIAPEQTAVELFDELAWGGAPLVVKTLAGLADGSIQPRPQNHAERHLLRS